MQTNLADWIRDTPQGVEADSILRKCVHCGFCLATCPTYGLLGDELDSPRGRIYLMKQMLEGAPVTERTQTHLDRCLTCRACETTCPSGVQYGRLVDIGREVMERKVERGPLERLKRWALRRWLLSRSLFGAAVGFGRAMRGLLPPGLARKVLEKRDEGAWPSAQRPRKMLVLQGCVQRSLAPSINAATARVLDRLGITLVAVPEATCCGAVSHHMNAHEEALGFVRANVDAWWPHIEAGAEAIAITASGCGTMVADYGHLLRGEPPYAERAARISAIARDISMIVAAEGSALANAFAGRKPGGEKLAFHSPCSLQHGLRVQGVVEDILRAAGFTLTAVPDGHLCCGSAGTYSILQPGLSQQLLRNKVAALESGAPEAIATANIGCMAHLASGSSRPVRHWIEILDGRLGQ